MIHAYDELYLERARGVMAHIRVPISDIRNMYDKYHEMDIRHFAERMDQLCRPKHCIANRKIY